MNQQANACLDDQQIEEVALGECTDQTTLRHIDQCDRCKSKLEEIQSNNRFLDLFAQANPQAGSIPNTPAQHDDEPIPKILPGGYKVECEIHRGGHGIVYRATQIRTNRPVAVKMLILGTNATPRQRMRFEREAEIIARLRHPGIVTIYDAGYLDDGRFGFAMEYVDGVTLDHWAASNPVESQNDIRARLKLFLMICDAVNFAHQFGVVHRDLKPANILIDKDNKPHILDFGIAKVLKEDADASTRFGQSSHYQSTNASNIHHTMPGEFSGTLAYASPEQVSGNPKLIDLRTDVYSLGVILYELLSGHLPYAATGSITDVIHRIQSEQPNPLTQHFQIIPRDLSEIVAHTLQKDKLDRYESVQDLSQDIQNYLDGRPIDIRRNSAWYVVHKTVRRKWITAALLSISLLALTTFSFAMTLLYIQKNTAEIDAILQLRSRDIAHAHTEGLIGDASLALEILWNAQLTETKGLDKPQELLFGNAFEPIDSYWELWSFYARNPCLQTTAIKHGLPNAIAVSSDEKTVVSYSTSQLHFYSAINHELLRTVDVALPDWLTITYDETQLGLIDDDQAVVLLGINGIAVFNAHTGKQISTHRLPNTPIGSAHTILRNGDVATGVAHRLSIIDPLHDGLQIHLDTGEGVSTSATLNATGSLLATTTLRVQNHISAGSTISIWSMPKGNLIAQTNLSGNIRTALFTPDMNSVLLPHYRTGIQTFWSFKTKTPPHKVLTTPNDAIPRAWLNAGNQLVCAQQGQTISIWDMNTKTQSNHFTGTSKSIRHILANQNSSTLTTISDNSIKTWNLDRQSWTTPSQTNSFAHLDVALSPNSYKLAWARNQADNYQIHLETLDSDSKPIIIDNPDDLITSLSFDQHSNQLAWSLANGQVALWDIESNTQTHTFKDHLSGVRTIAMSPTQNLLATGGEDAQVILRDLNTGKIQTLLGHSKRIPKVIFRPDGRVLASASMDGTIRLWDTQSGSLLKVVNLEQGIYALSFGPDNIHLAAGGKGQNIIIINTLTDKQTTLQGDSSSIFSLAYGPQGRVLISGDIEGNISLWDTQSTQRLAQLPKHEQMAMSITVSTDGRSMITCSAGQNPELRLWDLTTFNTHIAGNLEFHASRLEQEINKEPANLGAMRAWAAKIHGTKQ